MAASADGSLTGDVLELLKNKILLAAAVTETMEAGGGRNRLRDWLRLVVCPSSHRRVPRRLGRVLRRLNWALLGYDAEKGTDTALPRKLCAETAGSEGR